MHDSSVLRLSRKLALLALLILSIVATSTGALGTKKQNDPTPKIVISHQGVSPLRVDSYELDQAHSEINLVLSNNSAKEVRAYTVRWFARAGSPPVSSEGWTIVYVEPVKDIMKPGDKKGAYLLSSAFSGSMHSVVIDVDFVEFVDNTTWGPNKSKTDEQLAGQRAGVRDERERFRKLYSIAGEGPLLEAVRNDGDGAPPPIGHSDVWGDGYSAGIRLFRSRLKQLYERNGSAGIGEGLKQPIDASERNP